MTALLSYLITYILICFLIFSVQILELVYFYVSYIMIIQLSLVILFAQYVIKTNIDIFHPVVYKYF